MPVYCSMDEVTIHVDIGQMGSESNLANKTAVIEASEPSDTANMQNRLSIRVHERAE